MLIIVAKVPAASETRAKPINSTNAHAVASACALKIATEVLKRLCPMLPGASIDKERERESARALIEMNVVVDR